jgi:Fe2+ transport system protein FeoA
VNKSAPDSRTAASARSLAELSEGDTASVVRLDLTAEVATRLMELGFIPGSRVTAGHSAPGGDPRVFRVDGSEVALRRETTRHIVVEAVS